MSKFRLGDAQNTHNPALIVLSEKGYELYIMPPEQDEDEESSETEIGFWCARKGEREFIAGDPLALLGLVAIWEYRADVWKRDGDPDLYNKVIEDAYGD